VFRPERGRLFAPDGASAEDSSKENVLRGNIVSSEYLGDATILGIQTEHGRYTSSSYNPSAAARNGMLTERSTGVFQTNTPVHLFIDPGDLWIVPD
jgi:hypothetical protein